MHSDHQGFFATLDTYADMLINGAAIFIAYMLTPLVTEPALQLSTAAIFAAILIAVILSSFVYQAFHLYRPAAFTRSYPSVTILLLANLLYFGVAAAAFAIFGTGQTRTFLLVWTGFTLMVSTAILVFKRQVTIEVLAALRRRQYYLRKVIIIGDNTASASEYIRQVSENDRYGVMIIGYVGDRISEEVGCEKLGPLRDVARIFDKYQPTDVVFAIDTYDKRRLIRLVNLCDDRCIKVYFLPVIFGFFKSPKQIEQVGALPLINIHRTPLDNRANAALKRVIDIIGSLVLILLTSPLMLAAAIGVRLTSPGPILYRQARVGRMGKRFTMLKFRSMRVNQEAKSTWTTDADPRKTRFGSFLRRTSIDELPQLFNVLVGSMSLVGPRPEIPHFVNHFREIIPLYMVKHYVKPGMTGLAQIKGLRGDTSVEDRIHEDIAYIENWSLALDIGILLKTPFKAFNRNERYAPDPEPTPEELNEELNGFGQGRHTAEDFLPEEPSTGTGEQSSGGKEDAP